MSNDICHPECRKRDSRFHGAPAPTGAVVLLAAVATAFVPACAAVTDFEPPRDTARDEATGDGESADVRDGDVGDGDVPDGGEDDGALSPDDAAREDGDGDCTPSCIGRSCGDDDCGGICGPGCRAGETCDDASGRCVPVGPTCTAAAGYPVRPGTSEPVCPPYDRPFVFLSPHPDDETIAAAGTMRRYLDEGRDVFVELLTQGETAHICSGGGGPGSMWLGDGGSCPWHSDTHDYPLTDPEACAAARVAEFLAAVAALGVTGVRVNDYGTRDLTVAEVTERIDFWRRESASGLTLAGPAGPYDLYWPTTAPHRDHVAVFDALLASGHTDVMYFLEYYFNAMTSMPGAVLDIETWCTAKARAGDEYRLWAPEAGRLAVAYHSDPTLFDNGVPRPDGSRALTACHEYLWLPGGGAP